MRIRPSWMGGIAALTAALFAIGIACGPPPADDDDDNGDDGNGTMTGGPTDAGDDTGVNEFDTGGNGTDTQQSMDSGNGGADMKMMDSVVTDSGNGGGDVDSGSAACTFFPDSCGQSQICIPGMSGRQCANFQGSSKSEGDMCSGGINTCGSDMLCLITQGSTSGKCRNRCNPQDTSTNGCSSDRTCIQTYMGFPGLGLCVPSCTLYPNDSCGKGENCYQTPNGKICAPYNGSASEGDSCQSPTDCNNNQVCTRNSGCRDKCTMSMTSACGSGETCNQPSGPFGFCASGGGGG